MENANKTKEHNLEKLEKEVSDIRAVLRQKMGVADDLIANNEAEQQRNTKKKAELDAREIVIAKKEIEIDVLKTKVNVKSDVLEAKEQDYVARNNKLTVEIKKNKAELKEIEVLKEEAYSKKSQATLLLAKAEKKEQEAEEKLGKANIEEQNALQSTRNIESAKLELRQEQKKTQGMIGALKDEKLEVSAKKAEVNKIIRKNRLQKEIDEYKIT